MGCWTANLHLSEDKLALMQPILPYKKGQATEAESNHKDWARHVHLKAISKPQAAQQRGSLTSTGEADLDILSKCIFPRKTEGSLTLGTNNHGFICFNL